MLYKKGKLIWLIIILLIYLGKIYFSENNFIYEAYLSNNCHDIIPINENSKKLSEKDGEYWYFKGLCCLQTNNYTEARESFLKSVNFRYHYKAYAYFGLAVSEFNLSNIDEGINYMQISLNNGLRYRFLNHSFLDKFQSNEYYKAFKFKNKPYFSFWTSILVFLSVQGILFGLFLIIKKSLKRTQNIYIALIIIGFSLLILSYSLSLSKMDFYFKSLNHIHHYLLYSFGPLLYIYFKKTIANINFTENSLKHFIPIVLIGCSTLLSDNNIISYSLHEYIINPIFKFLHLMFYLIACFMFYKTNKKMLNEKVLNWFLIVLSFYTFFILANISSTLMFIYNRFDTISDIIIILSMGFFVIISLLMGYVEPIVFTGNPLKKYIGKIKYGRNGISKELSIDLKHKLIGEMQDEKLFLDNKLTLAKLSTHMNISKHHLSQVINENFNIGFFDFINRFRVDEVIKILECNPHTNILEAAYSSGFNNKASFNKAFKKITKYTPTEYRSKFIEHQ